VADNNQSPAQPLFRQQALDALKGARYGKPAALLPVSWTLLSACLIAMVLALTIFLATTSYARKESAQGIVRSASGETRIRAPAGGVIQRVLVTEGQQVKVGDPIMTVVIAHANIDGSPINAESLASLEKDLADLNDRLGALKAAADVQQSGFRSRLEALQSELVESQTSERLAREQLLLAEEALAIAEPAAKKGFVSGESMRRRHQEVLFYRREVSQAGARQAALRGQIAEIRAAHAGRPYMLEQERGELLDRISSARRERDTLVAQRGFSIKAPTSGIVTALQVSDGQTVDAQQALMDISAPAAPLVAEVYVPSRAIGFLKAGQDVRIRYDAFPYQQFGSAKGTVRAISATVLKPGDVRAPVRLEEPTYRVLIDLQKDTVFAYGKQFRIQPGSALTADIIIDRRTFAQWLLDPIFAIRGHL
jgi:membrane fusion protein